MGFTESPLGTIWGKKNLFVGTLPKKKHGAVKTGQNKTSFDIAINSWVMSLATFLDDGLGLESSEILFRKT